MQHGIASAATMQLKLHKHKTRIITTVISKRMVGGIYARQSTSRFRPRHTSLHDPTLSITAKHHYVSMIGNKKGLEQPTLEGKRGHMKGGTSVRE